MLYYLDLHGDGDDEYGFGDGDGATYYEKTIQTRSHTTADGITPYQHQSASYPLSAVDLLVRLASRGCLCCID